MIKKKTFLAVIPARGGSKGIKFKNIQKVFKDKTLLDLSYIYAKKCKFIDRVVVNTDHKKIVNFCKKKKYDFIIRPKNLSLDYVSAYKVMEDSINQIPEKYDYLIYLEPTSPFRKKNDLLKACKKIIKTNAYSCWSVNKVSKKFHPQKLLIKKDQELSLYDPKGKNIIARQQLKDLFQRNGIFYIFNIKKLLKFKSIYLKNTFPFEINYAYVNLDTPQDLKDTKKLILKFKI